MVETEILIAEFMEHYMEDIQWDFEGLTDAEAQMVKNPRRLAEMEAWVNERLCSE